MLYQKHGDRKKKVDLFAYPHVGYVTNNQDPENRGRVVAVLRSVFGQFETTWADVYTSMAGDGYGAFRTPEINEKVLVLFIGGDPHSPAVVASGYGYDKDGTAYQLPNEDDITNRVFRTPAGNQIMIRDKEGEESIEVTDKNENKLSMNKDEVNVESKSGSKLTLSSDKSVTVTSAAGTIITIDSSGKMVVNVGTKDCEIQASNVKITGTGNVQIGNTPIPATGFCGLPNCIFSGAPHTTNTHPAV